MLGDEKPVHTYIRNSVPEAKGEMLREIGVASAEKLYAEMIPERLWLRGPMDLPEPFTPEPCETYSKEDIDYWASVLEQVIHEAYTDRELVRTAPHNSLGRKADPAQFNDPETWAMIWRAYKRKRGN